MVKYELHCPDPTFQPLASTAPVLNVVSSKSVGSTTWPTTGQGPAAITAATQMRERKRRLYKEHQNPQKIYKIQLKKKKKKRMNGKRNVLREWR